jgi:16S rRNA processing protein RimM
VLDDDEYRVDDVIGLKVVTIDGKELGKVDRVDPYPAQDILIIGDIMIPFVEQFVTDIDFEVGIITVDLIPGMLGEEDDEAEPI